MNPEVSAFAPATVANIACGFDVLAFAFDGPGDTVTLRPRADDRMVLLSVEGDDGGLPREVERNTAGIALLRLRRYLRSSRPQLLGPAAGLDIELRKGMPSSSGLGSSAASPAAALTAANALWGAGLTPRELLPFAIQAEEVACGTPLADNAGASLLGGIVLVRSYDPLDVVSLPVPDRLWCAVVHPDLQLDTARARRVLSPEIPLAEAVKQWGNVAGLVAGLASSDYALIGRSLQDHVAEPRRMGLVPGFPEAKKAALNAGALGCSLSGSGPSLFALAQGPEAAHRSASAVAEAFRQKGIGSQSWVSRIRLGGAQVLEEMQ